MFRALAWRATRGRLARQPVSHAPCWRSNFRARCEDTRRGVLQARPSRAGLGRKSLANGHINHPKPVEALRPSRRGIPSMQQTARSGEPGASFRVPERHRICVSGDMDADTTKFGSYMHRFASNGTAHTIRRVGP